MSPGGTRAQVNAMTTPSSALEVESILRWCNNRCIMHTASPESPLSQEAFADTWYDLLDLLREANRLLPPAAAGGGVHNWAVFQEIRTFLSATCFLAGSPSGPGP